MCNNSKRINKKQSDIAKREKIYDSLYLNGVGEDNKRAGELHKENQNDLIQNDKAFKLKSKNEGEE